MRLHNNSITGISLDAAGLVALADLSTISRRTALTGSASYLDVLVLAPGIHTQQEASNVNGGELPTTGAMTTGHVFRIDNQAVISYLQMVGELGCLVTVTVVPDASHTSPNLCALTREVFRKDAIFPSLLYSSCIVLTVTTIAVLGSIRDLWALGVLLMLAFARFLNIAVIRRRTAHDGWKGTPEPGVRADLLVLLSQDRWVRMQGLADDLKAVTAGQWLREQTTVEGFASSFATLLVYVAAALTGNSSTVGSLFIAAVLLISVALLGLSNSLTKELRMFGRRVFVSQGPKKYAKRSDMAKELIEETGRSDWAILMGLILPSDDTTLLKVTL